MPQREEPSACQNAGYAISTIASGTIAGGAVGLMQGNLALAGGLAGVGLVAGVAQVISQPSSGNSNATQVGMGVLVGGIGGAAVRGGTSVSGGMAGGVVGGLFSAAGAPLSVSGYTGGLVGGLGVRAATLSQIGANLTRGAITGLAAGLIGDVVNTAGRAATDDLCQ